MKQPELGKRLTALRKEKNLTQEELVEKSHVSVRTIQRIEAGEVLPRMITVKILLEALGENYESFSTKPIEIMETPKSTTPTINPTTLLVAALAGIVYLILQIMLGAMDMAWIISEVRWKFTMNAIYTGLTVSMVLCYIVFVWGFILLSTIFENVMLKGIVYVLAVATIGLGVLDVATLGVEEPEELWIPYSAAAVIFGALSVIFGVALMRLQDSMGEICRIAGFLEIALGICLITVVLFFISHLIMIPAVILEITILYRGYEYLSKAERTVEV
jgi:transcriptional regulator with XRE-family HTH domain